MRTHIAALGAVLLIAGCTAAGAVNQPVDEPLIDPIETTAPADTGNAQWQEFSLHLAIALPKSVGLMNGLTDSLDVSDYAGGVRSIDRLDDFLREELNWLEDNDPEACYADMHSGWMNVFNNYQDALTLARPFLVDFPYGDINDMNRATELIGDAATQTNELTDAIPATGVACS